jgi:uncharacterized DUF497 family protein
VIDAVIIWDLADDEDGNVQHIAEHGITIDEVEEVLLNGQNEVEESRSSDNSIIFGRTSDERFIAVVFEHVDDDPLTLRPVTAYEVPERRKRKKR